MKIEIKKTIKITNENEWFLLAPPKGKEKQWKDGFSAKELAKFVISDNKRFTQLIKNIVKGITKKVPEKFLGEPEAITSLPGKGLGRNHDLLLCSDNLVIGIEAKVNEPYGESIGSEYTNPETTLNKKQRIEDLWHMILPNMSLEELKNSKLRYQLFTATAGTLLEAHNRGIKKCILLVLSFRYEDEDSNHQNEESFFDFVETICNGKDNNNFEIKDDNIECWFRKQEIVMSRPTYQL